VNRCIYVLVDWFRFVSNGYFWCWLRVNFFLFVFIDRSVIWLLVYLFWLKRDVFFSFFCPLLWLSVVLLVQTCSSDFRLG